LSAPVTSLNKTSTLQKLREAVDHSVICFNNDGKDYTVTPSTLVGETFESFRTVTSDGTESGVQGETQLAKVDVVIKDSSNKRETTGYISKDGKLYIKTDKNFPNNGGIQAFSVGDIDRGKFDLLGTVDEDVLSKVVENFENRAAKVKDGLDRSKEQTVKVGDTSGKTPKPEATPKPTNGEMPIKRLSDYYNPGGQDPLDVDK